MLAALLASCKERAQTTKPTLENITESIYASGIVKSKGQYQAYASISGIVDRVYASEGDSVKIGSPILSVSNTMQRLSEENAELNVMYSDYKANQGKLNEAKLIIALALSKMENDSLLYVRQRNLWQQQIGARVELEQRELAFQNAKAAYLSSLVKYNDLNRQLQFNAAQSKKTHAISSTLAKDYMVRSEMDGVLYSLEKKAGEIVSPQTPLAIIGAAHAYILEMQVDEYDILKIHPGLPVFVSLDSYKDTIFKARVTKINPLMNERSKTFLVEAEFIQQPLVVYPNISFEANIVVNSREKAMLIPRNFMLNDSEVVKSNGDRVVVKTGIKDYRKIEIRAGLKQDDELLDPEL